MKNVHPALLAFVACAVLPAWASAQSIVDLGSAASFAVLAGSGITVAGAANSTTITGDIGSTPTASITGLANVVLNGTNHLADGITQNAKSDLAAAFADASGRTPTTTYGPIFDLGGMTLTAGVYNDPSSFAITGTLTLDGQGNPNSVWIFQAGSTLVTNGLTTNGNSQVLLIGGAQANNVFWLVGSSATLGGSSAFAGNVLASMSITLDTGTSVEGRLLAINGSVTLDSNTITVSAGGIPEPADAALLIAAIMTLAVGFRHVLRLRVHQQIRS